MAVAEHAGARTASRTRAQVPGLHRLGPWNADAIALVVVVGMLVLIGLVMSLSASFVDAAETGDPFGVARRQAMWAGIGTVMFLLASRVSHRIWRGASWLLLPVSIAGLVAVLVPGVGITVAGSTRWVAIGALVVQPSELAKLAVLLWVAEVLTRKREHGIVLEEEQRHLLVPALPLLAILATLTMLEPDLGTTVLLGLIVVLVLWAEGISARALLVLLASAATLGAVAAVVEPYRFARITGWWRPEADPLGNGYQLLQSLYALGSGGWFGLGLGSSRGKWNFVPNPETDFIFAIIGEELGLLGAALVLGLFAGLLVVGLRIARRAPDRFGRTVAMGVSGWLAGQALVNIAAVTGLLPITGVPLPLVSVGGSSLVSTLTALGVLVAVARGHRPGRRQT